MNKLHLILSLFFSFVFISVAIAQDAPSDTIKVEKKQRWLRKSTLIPLPIAFYTPETRFGGGAATLFAFRFGKQTDEDRPSQVQLGLAYTQERQIIAYFPFQVFTKDAEYYYKGEIGYYRYSYRFYGIGNDVPKENEERFQVDFPRFRLDAQKLVKPNLYFGFRYWFDNYKITEKLEGGLLDTQTITGQNGSRISGLGLISTYDTRDIIFFPRKGYFIESELFFNQKWTGSDFDYMRITIDATKYIPLGKKPTLAINAYGVSLHGNVPFQQLALIGGPKKMRGFFEGRFRDKNLWMLQAEIRSMLFWKIGGTIFGGMGAVAPEIGDFGKSKPHFTFGAGLRFRVSEKDKINIRLDAGFNEKGEFYPYITVGEAF